MRAGLIVVLAVVLLVPGSIMGVASLLLLPVVGAVVLIAVFLSLLARKAQNKPPMP